MRIRRQKSRSAGREKEKRSPRSSPPPPPKPPPPRRPASKAAAPKASKAPESKSPGPAGRPSRRRPPASRNPLAEGVRATGREISRALPAIADALLLVPRALRPLAALLFRAASLLELAASTVLAALLRTVLATASASASAARAADRLLTPRRGLLFVAVAAACLLVASQLIDYRAIEIGQPGYQGLQDVATPPRVSASTPIDTHSIALLALAAIAVAAPFAGVVSGRRRQAAALIALIGAACLAVTLAIDLPRGLDEGTFAISFAGAHAVLLSGFWLELCASATLLVCGGLLLLSPSAETGPSRSPAGRARPGPPGAGRLASQGGGA